MLRVEYDDGKPVKDTKDRVPAAMPRGRARGFYIMKPGGTEHRIPIGFMRASEAVRLEEVLNKVFSE